MRVGLYSALRDRAPGPLLRLVYRIEVRGLVPPGPCIVVANHESLLDPVLLPLAAREPLRFMAKEELFRTRLGAGLLEALGAFPVGRGRGDHEAVDRGVELLAAGAAIAIFPAGNVQDDVWHRGAARLALHTGAPLVPVRIENAARALSRGRIGFPRIRILVGEPIPVERAKPTIAAARALTDAARNAVRTLSP